MYLVDVVVLAIANETDIEGGLTFINVFLYRFVTSEVS